MIDLKIIKSYLDSGLSVIPVNGGNGNTPKAPAVSEWKVLMKERMPDDSVERYFYNAESIGIFGGYSSLLGYTPNGEVIIRCLYLHTLQNMFHAITQKELDIDLKK